MEVWNFHLHPDHLSIVTVIIFMMFSDHVGTINARIGRIVSAAHIGSSNRKDADLQHQGFKNG